MRTWRPATPRARTTTSLPEDAPTVTASPLTRCISVPPVFLRTSRFSMDEGPPLFYGSGIKVRCCLGFVGATSNLHLCEAKAQGSIVSQRCTALSKTEVLGVRTPSPADDSIPARQAPPLQPSGPDLVPSRERPTITSGRATPLLLN